MTLNPIDALEERAFADVDSAATTADLRALEIRYLGRNGEYTALLRQVGTLPEEERPTFGQSLNQAKGRLQQRIDSREGALKDSESSARALEEAVDITMPGRRLRPGLTHILRQAEERIRRTLIGLGFEFVDGPELELVKYNFTALNYPPEHPAMDDQDTFYVDDEKVLRTQCTAIQGRTFESRRPPLRAFTIGRCFRNESVDRTHGHTFHQVDAFMIDEGIGMSHLKGTLGAFARKMFGEDVQVRFRPDYFPFVEPGVDYAISCPFCKGTGCAVCKQSGWIELGGAGLIHPSILRDYDIDTERWSGFAFGLGVERIPMMRHQIDDLRLFYDNDMRFLEQFQA
jgi:phenylalanyl-tRNA synthetase alpha chain